jgi:hypothetical protein
MFIPVQTMCFLPQITCQGQKICRILPKMALPGDIFRLVPKGELENELQALVAQVFNLRGSA